MAQRKYSFHKYTVSPPSRFLLAFRKHLHDVSISNKKELKAVPLYYALNVAQLNLHQ